MALRLPDPARGTLTAGDGYVTVAGSNVASWASSAASFFQNGT